MYTYKYTVLIKAIPVVTYMKTVNHMLNHYSNVPVLHNWW